MAINYVPKAPQAGVLNSVKAVSIDEALAAQGTRHTLAIIDGGTLNDYLGVFNSLAPLGTRLGIQQLQGNAVRVTINSYSGDFAPLTDIGIGNATFAKVKSVVLSYTETQYKSEKYLNGDAIAMDANQLAAAKQWFTDRATYQLRSAMIASRKIALSKIADGAGVHVTLSPTATSEEIYKLVQNEALKFQTLEDDEQGIQLGGIQSDNVTIYARPEAFAKVVGYRNQGDAVAETFDLGVLSTASLGGFKVVIEPALPINTPFLIGTDSTAIYDFLEVYAGVIQFETYDIASHIRVRELFGKVVNATADPSARVGSLTAGNTAPATKQDAFLATAIRYA